MTNIFDNYYLKSLLSKAAYSPNSLSKGDNVFDSVSGLTESQTSLLNDTYELISTRVDTLSGFEAAVFRNKKTGDITMAVAGTDDDSLADILDDSKILTNGLAIEQFMQAFNYYQEISSDANQVYKITLKSYDTPPSTDCYTKVVLDIEGSIKYLTYEYTLSDNTLPVSERGQNKIDFTGHSLGGHLSGLLSMVTGAEVIIFNAPGYNECESNFQEVIGFSEDGSPILREIGSDIDLLVNKLAGGTVGIGNVKHISNDTGLEWISNYGIDWSPTINIDGLSKSIDPIQQHGINNVCNTLYAESFLRDVLTANCFISNTTGVDSCVAIDNTYKAYCLYVGRTYTPLDYSNTSNVQNILKTLENWISDNGYIKIDIYNEVGKVSPSITGTTGADVIYTGGGNDTVNAGSGNDIVYGGDFFNNEATGYTKNINLGSGSDKYHGGIGVDIVNGGSGQDSSKDRNTVHLGGGSDEYTGGNGVDRVFGGSGNNEIHLGVEHNSDAYFSNVGNGEIDVVWDSTEDDYIVIAGGIREHETKGEDLYIYGNSGNGMYNADAEGKYPTHGLEINFQGKTDAFLTILSLIFSIAIAPYFTQELILDYRR